MTFTLTAAFLIALVGSAHPPIEGTATMDDTFGTIEECRAIAAISGPMMLDALGQQFALQLGGQVLVRVDMKCEPVPIDRGI